MVATGSRILSMTALSPFSISSLVKSRASSRPFKVQCSWVMAIRLLRPVGTTVRPRPLQGESLRRSGRTSNPSPEARISLAPARPYPMATLMTPSACPGSTYTGACTGGPRRPRSTRSCVSTPSCLAVAGLTSAAFSQVTLVTGSGSSCSQALFANLPSQTLESAMISSSYPGTSAPCCPPQTAPAIASARPCGAPAAGAPLGLPRRRRRRAPDEAGGDPLLPDVVEIGRSAAAPEVAQERVGRPVAFPEERRHHLRLGDPVEQGRDERLHEGGGAVVRASIAPVLERMGGGKEPARSRRRLVGVQAAVDGVRHQRKRLAEVQVGGG